MLHIRFDLTLWGVTLIFSEISYHGLPNGRLAVNRLLLNWFNGRTCSVCASGMSIKLIGVVELFTSFHANQFCVLGYVRQKVGHHQCYGCTPLNYPNFIQFLQSRQLQLLATKRAVLVRWHKMSSVRIDTRLPKGVFEVGRSKSIYSPVSTCCTCKTIISLLSDYSWIVPCTYYDWMSFDTPPTLELENCLSLLLFLDNTRRNWIVTAVHAARTR